MLEVEKWLTEQCDNGGIPGQTAKIALSTVRQLRKQITDLPDAAAMYGEDGEIGLDFDFELDTEDAAIWLSFQVNTDWTIDWMLSGPSREPQDWDSHSGIPADMVTQLNAWLANAKK